jgi:DNA-binding NarL/FixJ family response regulator
VTAPIRVLVVDDDALVRAALRAILSSAPDVEVVGEADDGATAPAAAVRHRPDVVLMDVRMPDVDGITATRRLRAVPGAPQVVVMTTFHLDEYVFSALRSGASGFLLKDASPAEIISAVRAVAAGDAMLSPAVTRTLVEHYSANSAGGRRAGATAALAKLTARERDVAVEVGAGRPNAEIAARLHMSEATVKAHMSRLLTKLGADNRVQVALLVRDAEIT